MCLSTIASSSVVHGLQEWSASDLDRLVLSIRVEDKVENRSRVEIWMCDPGKATKSCLAAASEKCTPYPSSLLLGEPVRFLN